MYVSYFTVYAPRCIGLPNKTTNPGVSARPSVTDSVCACESEHGNNNSGRGIITQSGGLRSADYESWTRAIKLFPGDHRWDGYVDKTLTEAWSNNRARIRCHLLLPPPFLCLGADHSDRTESNGFVSKKP